MDELMTMTFRRAQPRLQSVGPALAGLLVMLLLPFAANADIPGKHPAYLHALSDLRAARWYLEHRPGDPVVSRQEYVGITDIDAAIIEIKRAAIDDGKDIHDHPGVQDINGRPGRLHKALEILRKARSDITGEEDDLLTRELRNHSLEFVDDAIYAVDQAIQDVAPLSVILNASAYSMRSGGSVTLYWNVSNASSCEASGGWTGALSATGSNSESEMPTSTTTYKITCTGSTGNSASQSVTVTISPNESNSTAAYDYMVMNVCVDANDSILPASPFDTANCHAQRDIKPGEMPPYYSQAWGKTDISRRYSLPSSRVGTDGSANTHPIFIHWTDHRGTSSFDYPDNVGMSTILNGYTSDLGSTGGQILSLNLGVAYANQVSPLPQGIARFAKSWLFFNINLATSDDSAAGNPLDNIDYTTSGEQLANMSRDTVALPLPVPVVRKYFSLAVHKSYGFGPNAKTPLMADAIIENKYSGSDAAGLSPGDAGALERVYFTKQVGTARHESWIMPGEVPPSTSFEDSANLRNECAEPAMPLPDGFQGYQITPQFIVGPVTPYDFTDSAGTVHSWSQTVTSYSDATGSMVQRTWYLNQCTDWTNVTVSQLPYNPQIVVSEATLLQTLMNFFVTP